MRTSTGCKTCKIRHRKCDGRRPQCQNCTTRGLTCGGFGPDLKWFNESGDSRRATRAPSSKRPDSTSSHTITESERDSLDLTALFEKFIVSGRRMLLGIETETSSAHAEEIRRYGKLSRALFGVCVAVQLHFDRGGDAHFHEAYKDALAAFRDELQHGDATLSEPLVLAGIYLCTIEILQGNPWTLHLNGLSLLLQTRLQHPQSHSSVMTTRVTQILSVMELPAFIIGRKTPSQGLWTRYRASRMFSSASGDPIDEVEEMSGLPKSLLDLFVPDPIDFSERALWDWPGAAGTSLNLQLWEAYRLAAILDRRIRRTWAPVLSPYSLDSDSRSPSSDDDKVNIPTRVLILRCLSALQVIHQGTVQAAAKLSPEDLGLTTCVTYPLFVVSLQTLWALRKSKEKRYEPLSDEAAEQYDDAWQNIIEPWWKYLESMYKSENVKMQRHLVQEVVNRNSAGSSESIDDVARSLDWEITLL